MTKALMICGPSTSTLLATGSEINFFGSVPALTEANAQAKATEACTFSKMGGRIANGGSGTNTFTFRKNGANGNQTANRSGTGTFSDASNSDTLATNDTFNIAYTDTGTDSGCSWITGEVEFSSGFGCYVGAQHCAGLVWDVASSTRYQGIFGDVTADGGTDESTVTTKLYGYDRFEAFQVNIPTNGRANDSTIRNRIDAAGGSAAIVVATGQTGIFTATGLGDTIGNGSIVDLSVTLGTGVQDLVISAFVATLKTSDGVYRQDLVAQIQTGRARTASATEHYFTPGGILQLPGSGHTEANSRIAMIANGTAKKLRCRVASNTYTGDATLTLYKNGIATSLTATITAGVDDTWFESTGEVAIAIGDELSYGIVGGTSGSITLHHVGVTISATSGTSAQTLPSIEQSATGAETFSATSTQTLPNIEQSASGTAGDSGATGTAAQTLPNVEQAASGAEVFTGTAAQSLPRLSQSASGHMAPSGTAAQTLPNLEQSASGAETFTGTSAQLLPSIEQSATGTMQPSGTAAQELPSIVQSATGTHQQNVTGTAAQTLPSIEQQAAGTHVQNATGTAGQTLPAIEQQATAVESFTGNAAQLLPALEQAGTGALQIIGVGAQRLAAIIQDASGAATTLFIGTAESLLPAIEQAALGIITNPEEVQPPPPRVATSGLRAASGQTRTNVPGPALRSGSPRTTSRRNSPPSSGR